MLRVEYPVVAGAEFVNDDEICLTCHKVYTETFRENVHRGIHQGQSCEGCHGPASRHLAGRGKEPGTILNFKKLPPAQAAELCMKCHEENACAPGSLWRTSVHAHNCVTCVDCHTSHYNVPPGTPATTEPDANAMTESRSSLRLVSLEEGAALPSLRGTSNNLNAVAPDVCYKCHGDKAAFQDIAGPHQICGPNGFNCTTCHDPHWKIVEYSRRELCLECHKHGSPTMAFHASVHALNGVACTDCHNPHPNVNVPQFVGISHVSVARPQRLAMMAVNEPDTCYKCHTDIFAMNALPSHHPIKEGKMVCSDCHDPHGQMQGNLKAETVNLLCWRCHAEKQGPFAYEHPPVTENCGYCHNPHGTVANNLLKQPPVFLCLRCHVGHRQNLHGHTTSPLPHPQPAPNTPNSWSPRDDIDQNPAIRQSLYTDCTRCHTQIHGSDLPSAGLPGGLFR